jgi:hypothetical protein
MTNKKNPMKKFYVIILNLFILIFIFGCGSDNMKFNSKKWTAIENGLYGENFRKKMVNDLVSNKLQFGSENGTNRKEVIKLIGEPDFIDNSGAEYETYRVEEKIGMIDPNGYTSLKLEYNKDSILIFWKIEETRFRE